MSEKLRVGILGATGMVGQRLFLFWKTIRGLRSLLWQQAREALERHMRKLLAADGKWILQCRKQ